MKKLLYLMAAAAVALAACEKKDELNPTQKRINELTALEKTQAKEVRAAVLPALTQPEDIRDWFWKGFNTLNVPQAVNFLDSVLVYVRVFDDWHEAFGVTLPLNDANISILYTKCETYIATVEELEALKKQ